MSYLLASSTKTEKLVPHSWSSSPHSFANIWNCRPSRLQSFCVALRNGCPRIQVGLVMPHDLWVMQLEHPSIAAIQDACLIAMLRLSASMDEIPAGVVESVKDLHSRSGRHIKRVCSVISNTLHFLTTLPSALRSILVNVSIQRCLEARHRQHTLLVCKPVQASCVHLVPDLSMYRSSLTLSSH